MPNGFNAGLYTAATEHGQEIDQLLMFNWWIILPVFLLLIPYYLDSLGNTIIVREELALYYPHNNKLEAVWTIVPAIALAFIVIYGLMTWSKIL